MDATTDAAGVKKDSKLCYKIGAAAVQSIHPSHLESEANYTIHTFPQESAKCGDKIKAYISCFHLQLNPSFPFFRDI